MRIIAVGVIIRKGALETDTFILRGRRSLTVRVIWRSGGGILWEAARVRIRLWRRISMAWWWWRWRRRVTVLRLTLRTWRTERLTVGPVEHRLFAFPGIMSILATRSTVGSLTGHGRPCIRSVDGRRGHKGRLGRDRMEETLLVEADAVLAAAVRRAVIAGATDLERVSDERYHGRGRDGWLHQPFSCDNTCTRWPYAASEPAPALESSAAGDNMRPAGKVVAADMRQAAWAAAAALGADSGTPDVEGPFSLSVGTFLSVDSVGYLPGSGEEGEDRSHVGQPIGVAVDIAVLALDPADTDLDAPSLEGEDTAGHPSLPVAFEGTVVHSTRLGWDHPVEDTAAGERL